MSHTIIIRTDKQLGAHGATPQHASTPGSLAIDVTYTPSHEEDDKATMKKISKLLSFVRKMESSVEDANGNGEAD